MSANAIGYVVMQMPSGWLVDRIGVRWMLGIGEISAGILILGMFFVTSYDASMVILLLAGLGCGCLLTATTKAIMVWFPVKERATAMGLKQTSSNIGGIIAAVTLPTLALTLGWRLGFVIVGVIGIMVGIASLILYKEHPSEDHQETVVESGHSDSPVSKTGTSDIFLNREILLLCVIGFCMCVVEYSTVTHLVLYLKDKMLLSAVLAGGCLAVWEGGGAFGKPLFGLLSDRLFAGSRKKSYFLLTILTCIMCIVMIFLSPGAGYWTLIPVLVVFGLATIGWSGVHLALVGEFAGGRFIGLTIGFTSMIGLIGNIIGPPLFGYIVDTSGSYGPAWLFLAICELIAVVMLCLLREEKRKL